MGYIGEGLNRNGPRKDTVFVPSGGYTIIRFRADNIGYWFMHCHIESHMGVGMSLMFQTGSHKQIADLVKRDFKNACNRGFGADLFTNSSSRNDLFIGAFLFVFCFVFF